MLPLLALALVPLAGCAESWNGLGQGAQARAASDQLFGAVADRYVDVVRNAKYEYARDALTKAAFTPSRAFDDSAAWTGLAATSRVLETFGAPQDGRYQMTSRSGAPAPARPGEGRHSVRLTQLTGDVFRWDTNVDFAIGTISPDEVAGLLGALMGSAEGHSEAFVRASLVAGAPRTSAALGALFSLDTLRPVPLVDGTTSTTLVIGIHAERMRRRFPSLADYVTRYVEPARYRVQLADRAGVVYLDAVARDQVLTLRIRTRKGRLVSLGGAAREMPDSLLMTADFAVKVKLFTVGFHNLVMEFANTRQGPRQREWSVAAHREPAWNLPFITARLVRGSLRRPFLGEGASYRIGVRDGEGSRSSVLYRESRLTMQESGILSFVNSLSSKAMDDFGQKVELEQNLWVRELFLALRDDARLALSAR